MAIDKTLVKMVVGAIGDFLGLSDTPSDYTGHAGKLVTVNGTEDGLEFAAQSTDIVAVNGSNSKYQNNTNGYIEMWGTQVVGSETTATVTFSALSGLNITELDNANFHVSLTSTDPADRQDNLSVTARLTTSFTFRNSKNNTDTVLWKVTGFISV